MSTSAQGTPKTRIEKQLDPQNDKGALGFLKWARAALPSPVFAQVLQAAQAQSAQYRSAGLSGVFGDAPSTDSPLTTLTFNADSWAPTDALNAVASSAPASSDWASAISSALQVAGQAYLTKTQVDAMNSIAQVNIQRAQQGLPPLPSDPSLYGVPGPSVNVGLSAATTKTLMYGGAILAGVWLLTSLVGGKRGSGALAKR